jgi:hypothetical protein
MDEREHARRIENRRRIIASLRRLAEAQEQGARELRRRADQLQASTDALLAQQ